MHYESKAWVSCVQTNEQLMLDVWESSSPLLPREQSPNQMTIYVYICTKNHVYLSKAKKKSQL